MNRRTMMGGETKHTPGPWKVAVSDHRVWVYKEALGKHIADTDTTVTMPRAEQIANARLIAAAPDMLEALREIFMECYPNEGGGRTADGAALHRIEVLADEAIIKATGADR